MRSSIFLSALLGAASLSAADTLTLKTVVRYHQTILNSATKGAWDSTLVDVSDPANWAQVAPPSFKPHEAIFTTYPRTVTHPELIQFDNTASDLVRWVSIHDSAVPDPGSPGSLVPRQFVDSSTTAPVITRSNNSYYSTPAGNLNLSVLWSSANVLAVGKIVGDSVIQAWSGAFMGMNIPHDEYTGWALDSAVNLFTISQPTPARYNVEKYVDNILGTLFVSKIGKGVIDSTRAELVMYHYIFQQGDGSSGVRPRADRSQGMSALSTASGFEIRLGSVGSVRIVSPNGKVARTFAPASSIAWDGKDAAGRKLTGLWIATSEGQGALPLVLR